MIKNLKISGYKYKVKLIPNMERDEGHWGYQNANSQVIAIDDSICEESQMSTLLHEIIEALNFRLELKLEHNQITSLEAGLFQVLRDNNLKF